MVIENKLLKILILIVLFFDENILVLGIKKSNDPKIFYMRSDDEVVLYIGKNSEDYAKLAVQADRVIQNVKLLEFLNQTHVRKVYKKLQNELYHHLTEAQQNFSINEVANMNVLHYQRSYTNGNVSLDPNQITRRIVAGHNTSIKSVPWQVSIREKDFVICGGSIVSRNWILTAAHCALRSKVHDISVRLGSSFRNRGGEVYDVKEILVHPEYFPSIKKNDAALMSLYTSLLFTDKIMPIGIVPRGTRIAAYTATIVSGWGRTKESGVGAQILQSIAIQTVPMKLCIKSGLYPASIEPKSMFCAGHFLPLYPDACQGDSGGPIVSNGSLIGIVSWGLGCARGNFPGVYTRLSNPDIWNWIYSHISKPAPEVGIEYK